MKYRLSEQTFTNKMDASRDADRLTWTEYETDNPKELYNALLNGYTYCPIFNGWRRLKGNYKESYFVFIDIDHSEIPLGEYILSHFPDYDNELDFLKTSYPPTFAYCSLSHHNMKDDDIEYKFHLVWAFDRPLNSEQYHEVQSKIIEISGISIDDRTTTQCNRFFYGTNKKYADECIYIGDVYRPEQFIDTYVESIIVNYDASSELKINKSVWMDLMNKDNRTTDVLYKYTGKQYTDYMVSKPTFVYNGSKLWVKSDYKAILVPWNGKIKDGEHRRYKFSMMLRQLKEINTNITFSEFVMVAICISNFHFEHNNEFGSIDSVMSISRLVFNDNTESTIDWYCQSKTKGRYIVKDLNGMTRKELIGKYEASFIQISEANDGSLKNDTSEEKTPISYIHTYYTENVTKMRLPSRMTQYRHKKNPPKEKPKTIEELEIAYQNKQISKATYYRMKKKLNCKSV